MTEPFLEAGTQLPLKVFLYLSVALAVLTVFKTMIGLQVYTTVFAKLKDVRPLLPFSRHRATDMLCILISYLVVMFVNASGGGIVLSVMIAIFSGTAVDVETIKIYLFASAIIGIFVAGIARVASQKKNRPYGDTLIAPLYYQAMITISILVIFAYPLLGTGLDVEILVHPIAQAVTELHEDFYIVGAVAIMVIHIFVCEALSLSSKP